MDETANEEIRKYAAEVLAKLAEMGTPEAQAAGKEVEELQQRADAVRLKAQRFERMVKVYEQLTANIELLKREGRAVIASCAPFKSDPDNEEPVPPKEEEKHRVNGLNLAVDSLNDARGALIEAFTGNIDAREDRLEEAHKNAWADSDAADVTLEEALTAAGKLAGVEMPAKTHVVSAPRRGRPRRPRPDE